MADDSSFARLVSLACHDVRTPLATVHGFAKTLARVSELEPPADRYVEMIVAAAAQMAELLDELSLAARIESGRYEPGLREADTLALARNAAGRLGEERVRVSGTGATIETDPEALDRGVSALVPVGAPPRRARRGRGRRRRRRGARLARDRRVGAGRARRGPPRPRRRGGRAADRAARGKRRRRGRRADDPGRHITPQPVASAGSASSWQARHCDYRSQGGSGCLVRCVAAFGEHRAELGDLFGCA